MDFINGIPIVIRTIWIILLLSFNFLFTYIEKWLVRRLYEKTSSAEVALSRAIILDTYIGAFIRYGTTIPVMSLLLPFLRPFSNIGRLLCAIFFAVFIILISLAQYRIMFKTFRQIRDTTGTFKEQAARKTHFWVLTFIPVILYYAMVIFLPKNISDSIFSHSLLFFLFVTGFVLLVKVIISFLYKETLKTVPLKDTELLTRLESFLKTKVKYFRIFIRPAKKIKSANTLVISIFYHYNIFISDYLVENMSADEVEALLAHELGHEKKYHLWIRVFFTILWMPFMMLPADFFGKYDNAIPIWYSVSLIFVSLLLYLGFLFFFITHFQERQADQYALKMGIAPETMITALRKLAKLNNIQSNIGSMDNIFNSHSPIEKRIKWLMKTRNKSNA